MCDCFRKYTYILSTVSTVWIHRCKKAFPDLVHIDIVSTMYYQQTFLSCVSIFCLVFYIYYPLSTIQPALCFTYYPSLSLSPPPICFFLLITHLSSWSAFKAPMMSFNLFESLFPLIFVHSQIDFQRILLIFLFHTCIQIWLILNINITLFIMYVFLLNTFCSVIVQPTSTESKY